MKWTNFIKHHHSMGDDKSPCAVLLLWCLTYFNYLMLVAILNIFAKVCSITVIDLNRPNLRPNLKKEKYPTPLFLSFRLQPPPDRVLQSVPAPLGARQRPKSSTSFNVRLKDFCLSLASLSDPTTFVCFLADLIYGPANRGGSRHFKCRLKRHYAACKHTTHLISSFLTQNSRNCGSRVFCFGFLRFRAAATLCNSLPPGKTGEDEMNEKARDNDKDTTPKLRVQSKNEA